MPNLLKLASDMYNILNSVYDSFVNGIKQIDTDHYYIHAAKKYRTFIYQTIGTGNTYSVSFKTPKENTGLKMHFRPPIVDDSADKLRILLYRDNTYSDGSNLSIFNYVDGSDNTSSTQAFKEGVTRSGGTLINSSFIGGGTGVGGHFSGGSNRRSEEIVLQYDTIYCVDFVNGSGSDNIVNAVLPWYEETHN